MNRFYFFLAMAIAMAIPKPVFAHGANIEYRETSAVTIQAKYDDGTPMKKAQVVIYAPSDRATPWVQGTTDESGKFTFVPSRDSRNLGKWDVKVRQSGHGTITSIPIQNDKLAVKQMTAPSIGSGYSPSQKFMMAAAVGWGFVGTALFFSRSKSQ